MLLQVEEGRYGHSDFYVHIRARTGGRHIGSTLHYCYPGCPHVVAHAGSPQCSAVQAYEVRLTVLFLVYERGSTAPPPLSPDPCSSLPSFLALQIVYRPPYTRTPHTACSHAAR